jgi:hypothetical protein
MRARGRGLPVPGGGRHTPGGGPATTLLRDWEPDPGPRDLLPHRTRVTIRPLPQRTPLPWQVPGWWRRHLAGVIAVIVAAADLAVIFWPR